MVIKIWYNTDKSIESQGWMVICSNGTWKKRFYFCFIVFLSLCLTQVFINSLLNLKVSMLKKKKKYFPPSHFGRNYTSHSFSENIWGIVLFMAFSPSALFHATTSRCFEDTHLMMQTPDLTSILRNWVLRITALGLMLYMWSNPLIWNAFSLGLGNNLNLIGVKYLI